MGIANKTSADDNSGLYDLKELATSAKKRRSQRLSSEVDAHQSLLQSSAALDAVALPDPKKSQEIAVPSMTLDSSSSAMTAKGKHVPASATEALSFTEQPSASSSSKAWLLAGTAVIAIAGAAAFVLLSGKAETPAASASPAVAAITAPEYEIPTPVQALPLVEDEAAAVEDDVPVAALEPAPDEAEAVPEVSPEESAPEDDSQREAKSTKDSEKIGKRSASEDQRESKQGQAKEADDKPTKAEARAAAKAAAAENETPATKTEDLDSNASVDDILSSVTGGVESDKAVVEEKGPSKKRLDRGDLAKAMKAVSPQAKACFAAEEFSGMVTVKYSVQPDGSVSGAQATGAHKSSSTGACVAKAVRGASFPAFSGAAMSFSFPFLLSP